MSADAVVLSDELEKSIETFEKMVRLFAQPNVSLELACNFLASKDLLRATIAKSIAAAEYDAVKRTIQAFESDT